jgi:hypothetical protein
MKRLGLILLICLISGAAAAEFRPSFPSDADLTKEKRFQPLQAGPELFCLDSTRGDLWRFDDDGMRWLFIGSPRGADAGRKGTFRLESLASGALLVLDTRSGEAWWTDGVFWNRIEEPSTRIRKDD